MTDKLSADQNFNDLDVNNDQQLGAAELAQACNISELQASNIIQQYDVDGDGFLISSTICTIF